MSKIIDDAREKIAKELYLKCIKWTGTADWYYKWDEAPEEVRADWRNEADQILALSGTKDIECPECGGSGRRKQKLHRTPRPASAFPCHLCNGKKVIPYKWKVSVTLENGELPRWVDNKDWSTRYSTYEGAQKNMLNEGWVKDVRQVVE